MGTEIELDGATYSIGALSPMKQFHIARRMAPMLAAAAKGVSGDANPTTMLAAVPDMASALAEMSDADADYCLFGLLEPVRRQLTNALGWAPITNGHILLYQDITLPTMLRLAQAAFTHNLTPFLRATPQASSAEDPKPSAQ